MTGEENAGERYTQMSPTHKHPQNYEQRMPFSTGSAMRQ